MMLVLILLCTFHRILAQSDFTSSPSNIVSLIDGNATFRCSVGNFQPGDTLQWYRDGSQEFITNGATVLSSSFDQRAYIEGGNDAFMLGQYNLIISRLQASDEDDYRCTYSKAGSMATATTPASLTVLNRPTCSQNPISVGIGQEVVLTCALNDQDVNRDVITQVQWNFKNNIIASDPITTTTQRRISGDDNYQEFVCEMVVTEFPNIINSCSLLPLSINPSASISPTGTYIITKGHTIEFVCLSTAYPHTSSIDWLISGQSVYNFDDVFNFELSTDRMTFTLTVISSGEMHRAYPVQCRVYDPQGYTADSEMTTIVVEPFVSTTPSPTTTTIPTVPLSVFVQTPSDVTTTLGSVVVLHCAVNYLGDGVMKWFDVQKLVYIVQGLEVTSTSDDIRNRYSILGGREAYENGRYSLQITNAKVTDSGMYFCSYSSPLNSIYFSSDSATIEIVGTSPILPTTTRVPVVQTTTVPSPTYITLPKSASKSTPVQTTPKKRTQVYFIQTPSDTNTTAGSVVVLKCAVNHLGVGEMKWFKVESGRYIMVGLQVSISASDDIKTRYSIVGGNDAYSRGEYSLQIIDVKDTDKGTYFCSYSSPDATSISSGYAKLMLLGALLCQQTPDHALPSGAVVTMQCMVKDTNERTYVTWKSDIGIELTIPAINSVTYSVVLQPTDNFRAFTCSDVTSRAGEFARTCSLTPLAIQPVVKIIEGASEAPGGISVNFTCQAEAEPYVSSYEWLIDGMTLDTLNETFEFNTENGEQFLELTPIFNGENDATYNITCTVYIPSGYSTTSKSVHLLVTGRSSNQLASTDTYALTVVTLVVISLLAVIVGIVFLLLCFLLLCHGRRRKLSLARKISFNHRTISGGRYGARQSVDDLHIDGYGSTVNAIYASPLQIRNGKKGITEKKAAKAVRESIYENSAAEQRPNSITSEYMNYDHDQVFHEQNGVQPVGFSNFGYCPESPTSLRFNFSTLPTKPTVAPKPLTKRLSSFEPLPDVCSSRPNDYIDIRKLENEQNHKVEETGPDELIYSNEPVRVTQSKSNEIYDDFDSDSFDSDSEDETYM